jgi:hypothetical protein
MPKLGLANADVTVLVDFLSKAKANESGLRH